MNLTGYGTGATPEAAAADARRDLSEQMAALQFGNFIAQGIGGVVAFAVTVFIQFMMRPLPALVAGFVSWLLWLVIFAVFTAALPENPVGQVFATLVFGLVASQFLAPLAAGFAVMCTAGEVIERKIMTGLPGLTRQVIVTVTSLTPSIFAVAAIIMLLREEAAKGEAISVPSVVFYLLLGAVFQVVTIAARQRTGAALGDYDWLGRRVAVISGGNSDQA